MKVTILEDAGFTVLPCGRKHRLVRCKCYCGKVFVARKYYIESGRTKSCGCYRSVAIGASNTRRATHGYSTHPLYHTWYEMMNRCYKTESINYAGYGGRGISVCKDWHDVSTFIEFITSTLGPRPEGHELDRIDNDGDYCPSNVKWSTIRQQAQNRRSNVYLTVDGVTHCIAEWARITGVSETTLRRRMDKGLTGTDLLKPTGLSK